MSRPGFFFCICPDVNLISRQIDRLLQKSGQQGWHKQTIHLEEAQEHEKLWNALNLPAMTGSPRAVILRSAQTLTAGTWKKISPLLNSFKPLIWPFFCVESAWDKGRPKIPQALSSRKLYKFAVQKGWTWEFPGLTQATMARYIKQKCSELGVSCDPEVLNILCPALPLDSTAVDRELEKMALLTSPENVIRKEHTKVLSSEPDIDIFVFLQNLQKGHNMPGLWNKIFREQLKGEEMLFPFLGLLLRETRILWLLCTGQEGQVRLHPAVKKQKQHLAGQMGPGRIARLWDLILEAESRVKSGSLKPDQAMD
ncbi:MAG: DNA polymerase III subunit delta, partial [Desulfonatronovibrionaceae bacterium]